MATKKKKPAKKPVAKKAPPKKAVKKAITEQTIVEEAVAPEVIVETVRIVEVIEEMAVEKTTPVMKRRYQSHLDYITGISKNSMSTKRYVLELASRVPCAVKSMDKNSAYNEAVGYLTKKIGD